MKVVGTNVDKIDAFKLARGEPVFTDDFTRPGMLYAKVLRSPHAHARILNGRRQRRPWPCDGVVDVIWHRDVKAIPHTRAGQSHPEPSPYDTVILPHKARFIGDRVAIVVAETLAQAEAALELIEVDYEVLPAITDMDEALADTDVLIHEDPDPRGIAEGGKSNVCARIDKQVGDVDAALPDCDLVVERTYHLPRVQASHIEPHISIAWVDEDRRLTVRTSTQVPFHLRRILARILEMPEARIRVIKPRVGGGFGDKQEMVMEDLVAVLALRTGRPVRLEFTRKEELIAARYRHPQRITMTTGVMNDGTIVANRMHVLADTGAYGSHALTVQGNTGQKVLPMYPAENIHFQVECVYTNNPMSGAFRGYGAPQGCFALESHIDEVARELGMDRLELRRKNHIRLGDVDPLSAKLGEGKEGPGAGHPQHGPGEGHRTGLRGHRLGSEEGTLGTSFEARPGHGAGHAGLGHRGRGLGRGHRQAERRRQREPVGRGHGYRPGFGHGAGPDLRRGTGHPLRQGAHPQLGHRPDPLRRGGLRLEHDLRLGRRGGQGGHGKRARTSWPPSWPKPWDCDPADIRFRRRQVTGAGGKCMTMQEVALFALYEAKIQPMATASHMSNESPPPFAAQFADVEVDTETGQVFVRRFVSAVDCGTPIHPRLAEGQIEGAVAQAIGYALFEEVLLDRAGKVLNPNFLDYKIATALDMPEMQTILVETDEPSGPFGAKAAGEVPIDGPAPAIVNAICDAVGVRMYRIPATPERVWRGLKEETP